MEEFKFGISENESKSIESDRLKEKVTNDSDIDEKAQSNNDFAAHII